MPTKREVADKLYATRERCKVPRLKVSEYLDVTENTLMRWEKGRGKLPNRHIIHAWDAYIQGHEEAHAASQRSTTEVLKRTLPDVPTYHEEGETDPPVKGGSTTNWGALQKKSEENSS